MANFFYDGMPNVNECLNALYTAFAAGPYNALPLTGGTLTGPLSAPVLVGTVSGTSDEQEVLKLSVMRMVGGAPLPTRTIVKMGYYGDGFGTRMVSGGDPSAGYTGYTSFETGVGPSTYQERMRITDRGSMLIGTTYDNDVDLLQVAGSGGFVPVGQ